MHAVHGPYGGVVPELGGRRRAYPEICSAVVDAAAPGQARSATLLTDIDGIAP
jgi:hypothetical protein